MRGFILSSFLLFFLYASPMQTHTSYQGYTGLINIPTADIEKYGDIEFSYTKQVAYLKRWNSKQRLVANDHFFNIGILPYLEIGGRLADIVVNQDGFIRDLSANIKLQLPTFALFPEWMPKIALGYQDFAGETGTFKTKYIVATKQIKNLKVTVGYGFGSERLDGFFYGAEYKVNNYIYLLADDDTKYKSLGVLFNSYDFFDKFHLSLLFTKRLGSSYQYGDDFNFGINLKTSLYNDLFRVHPRAKIEKAQDIQELVRVLEKYGFENVLIGKRSDTLVIVFENHILESNEADAYKAILDALPQNLSYKKISLISKKSDIGLSEVVVDAKSHKVVDLSYDIKDFTTLYKGSVSSQFKTRIELYPGLKTFIGTEKGVFDYELSLKSHISWNLAKGLDFGMVYNLPLANSVNFEKGQAFRKYYEDANLESAMLSYTFKYKNFFNTSYFGLYKSDYIGIVNESSLVFDNTILDLKLGWFKNRNNNLESKKKIALASLSYYINNLDATIKLQAGKYFYQDKGFDITFKKFFKNNAIYFKYQYSKANKYVGIGFEIPLDFSFNSKKVQVKGINNFRHYVRSSVQRDDGTNQLVPSGLQELILAKEHESSLFNRGRVSKSYLNQLLRLNF